jgi:hypothetical protein
MTSRPRCIGIWILLAACGQADSLMTAHPEPEDSIEFAIDLWPGEGIPVIEARRGSLPLRGHPLLDAAIVDTLNSRVGQRVAFDSTRYQTIESGSIRVLTSLLVEGRDLGAIKHVSLDTYYEARRAEVSIPIAAPATIDLLQYRAEGTCFLQWERRVIDAQPCPGFGRDSVQVVREPVTRWWIGVRGRGGTFGWLLVSDSTAQSVRREF